MANNRAIIVELDKEVDTSLALNSIRQQEPVPNPCVETTNEPVVTKKCNHFSIRGYVSEVRKKDPKICYPFPLNESIDLAKELPPMTIPESRWWRCSGCVPEAKNNDSRGAAKEEAQKGVNVIASNNNLQLGLSSKVDNTAARVQVPAEAFTSTDSDYNKNYTPVVSNTLSDRKGKGKAHVTYDEIPPFSGRENGFLSVSSNQKPFQQTKVQIEINQRATDNNEVVQARSNQNRTVVGLHKEITAGRSEVGPSHGYSRGDPQTSTQQRLSESATNGLVNRVAGSAGGSSSRGQGLVKLPDLNACSDEPSDELQNEATVTGNYIILRDDDDDYLGTERRKRPKSRLMSELLSLKATRYLGKEKKKMISSTSSQDENVKRKRIEIVISESEDESDSSDVSDEKISGSSGKKPYKCKSPLAEMRKKKIKMDNGASSSVSQQKFTKLPKPSHEKGKSSAEELPQRVDCFAHLSEENKVVKRKRGTGAPARNMTKESGATQKDGEAEQNSTKNVGKPSGNVGQFLSSYPNKENNQPLLQKKDGFYPSSSQVQKENESRHYEEKRGVTLSRTTSAVGAPITGNKSDPEKRIDYPTTSSKEKTIRTPETDRCRPPAQDITIQVSNSVPNQKQQTKEVRGRVHDIDINSIPTDDKPTELDPGDDNLMEIAELMVKIRHDQQRNEPMAANPVTSGPPRPLPGTNVRQSGTHGSYGQPMQIFGSSPLLNQQKPPSTMVNGNSSQYSYYHSNNVGAQGLPRENQNPVSSRFVYPNQDVQQVHPYSARRLPPSNFAQAVDSHQKFQAWSPQQGLTRPSSSAWPPPGMPSRMPLGITNPRQMISPRSNTLNDGKFRQQNSRTLNFENPESSSSRSTGVDVNEAIPAMHLLSLMQNAATVQNTELSLGPQRLVAPSPSPSPSPLPSSSRFPFSQNNSRTFPMQDNSRHPCYSSTVPTASPFPSSLHNDKGIMSRNGGSNGFMGPIPLTLGGQRNMENSRFASPPTRNSRPPRQVRRPMAPPVDKGKSIASTSNPTSVNNNPLPVVKESLNLQCEEPVTPPEPEKITCQLNQNPSEFNDLKLLSKYLNGPEDLRRRKTSSDNASQPREN